MTNNNDNTNRFKVKLGKKIPLHELKFIRYSGIFYKTGWYADLLGIDRPPELYESVNVSDVFKRSWTQGAHVRQHYNKKIGNDIVENVRYDDVPDYIYVLYRICPDCGKTMKNNFVDDKNVICEPCGYEFNILINMPYKLMDVYRDAYPSIRKNRLGKKISKFINEHGLNYKIVVALFMGVFILLCIILFVLITH